MFNIILSSIIVVIFYYYNIDWLIKPKDNIIITELPLFIQPETNTGWISNKHKIDYGKLSPFMLNKCGVSYDDIQIVLPILGARGDEAVKLKKFADRISKSELNKIEETYIKCKGNK